MKPWLSGINSAAVRNVVLALIGGVEALTSPVQAQQPATRQQQIFQLLAAHQFQQAEQAATVYLKNAPADCNVRVLLGLALRGEQQMKPALTAFEAAAKQCPQSLAAVEGAAETAFLLNDPAAGELVDHVIQLHPQEETGYAMLGAIEARRGDCAGAVENYARAPARIGQNAAALRQYGGCLLALGRAAEAVPVLSRLLTLDNSKDEARNRLALAEAQGATNDRAAALATLEPLLATDSNALVLASRYAEADNDTPHAVEWLRRAISLQPRNANAYLAFSEISFAHGAYKVGVDLLNVGLEQLPGEARLYVARGVLEVQLTQNEVALEDFKKAHQLNPALSFADDAIGMLLSQKHDPTAALALFDQQRRKYPNDALLQYLYAESLSEAAQDDPAMLFEALATVTRAVQLEPGYQPARDLLCTLLLRHNDLEAVVAQAQEAVRRDPNDEVALYQELLAEHRLKHSERSAELVKQLQQARIHNQQGRTRYLLEEQKIGAGAAPMAHAGPPRP